MENDYFVPSTNPTNYNNLYSKNIFNYTFSHSSPLYCNNSAIKNDSHISDSRDTTCPTFFTLTSDICNRNRNGSDHSLSDLKYNSPSEDITIYNISSSPSNYFNYCCQRFYNNIENDQDRGTSEMLNTGEIDRMRISSESEENTNCSSDWNFCECKSKYYNNDIKHDLEEKFSYEKSISHSPQLEMLGMYLNSH